MTLKYEILKRLVKAVNIKKMWTGMSTEELLENRRRTNAKNRIPDLKDDAFFISRIDVMGFPVLKMIHRDKADKANLFLIGGGMISAPRPGSVKKALRFAKETGLDVFVPYYPLCTDYPLSKAYEMIHETYRIMLRDYSAENISVLGTSSGGNLALGMVPYINDGHRDTPMPGYIMAISPGTCDATEARSDGIHRRRSRRCRARRAHNCSWSDTAAPRRGSARGCPLLRHSRHTAARPRR